MTDFDLRPPQYTVLMAAGDSLDGLEVTVDDPEFATGTWTAQIRATAPDTTVHADFTITPNDTGTGVILSLTPAMTRELHTTHARVVRDPLLGMVNRYVGVFDVQSVAASGATLTALSGTLTLDQDVTR